MAEAINDAIISGNTDDPILDTLLELVVFSVANNRPLFLDPIEEPIFYRRYFYVWVQEALEDAAKINKAIHGKDPE